MKPEEDQELWDLLGNASSPVVSPFFARNVLREIRQESGWRETALRWLSLRRAIPAAAAFAICLITALTMTHQPTTPGRNDSDDVPDVVAKIDPSDYEVVADLDDLVAAQEDDSWDDTATL